MSPASPTSPVRTPAMPAMWAYWSYSSGPAGAMGRYLAAAVLAGSIGCGNDSEDIDPPPPDTVVRDIGPEGGLISSADGVLTISIRPGALDETQRISIAPSDEPPEIYSRAYRVQPDVPLAVGATVTFNHFLPERPAVGAVSRSLYEQGQGSWTKLPTAWLVADENRITAIDYELSVFYGILDQS